MLNEKQNDMKLTPQTRKSYELREKTIAKWKAVYETATGEPMPSKYLTQSTERLEFLIKRWCKKFNIIA